MAVGCGVLLKRFQRHQQGLLLGVVGLAQKFTRLGDGFGGNFCIVQVGHRGGEIREGGLLALDEGALGGVFLGAALFFCFTETLGFLRRSTVFLHVHHQRKFHDFRAAREVGDPRFGPRLTEGRCSVRVCLYPPGNGGIDALHEVCDAHRAGLRIRTSLGRKFAQKVVDENTVLDGLAGERVGAAVEAVALILRGEDGYGAVNVLHHFRDLLGEGRGGVAGFLARVELLAAGVEQDQGALGAAL